MKVKRKIDDGQAKTRLNMRIIGQNSNCWAGWWYGAGWKRSASSL